jgi:polar amino acid transport system substrate-binding protein
VKRLSLFVVSILVISSMLLAGCAPAATPAATEAPKPTEALVATEALAAPTEAPKPTEPPAPITIKVATDATFPPFETVDEATKNLTGFDVELMNALAEKEGLKVEWVNINFDAVLSGISQCQYDAAIAAITITDDRKKTTTFSEPYINAGQVVSIRKDETGITGPADLKGKKLGAQLGTTGEIEAKKIENAVVKPYDSYDLAFLDLMNGQIDAVIADYPTALGFVGKNSDKLMTVGDVFTNESYGIAVCNTNPDLLKKMNDGLTAIKADGTITKLEDKWLAGVSK